MLKATEHTLGVPRKIWEYRTTDVRLPRWLADRSTLRRSCGTCSRGASHNCASFRFVLTQDLVRRHGEADIKSRELGVLFDQLRVVGKGTSSSLQSTLGSFLNPMNILRIVQDLQHPHLRDIIGDFHGVVRPGEMLRMLPYCQIDLEAGDMISCSRATGIRVYHLA